MGSSHASPSAPLAPHSISAQIDGPSPLASQYPHHPTPSGSTVHQPSPAELDFDALFKQFEEGGGGHAVPSGLASQSATSNINATQGDNTAYLDFDLSRYAAQQSSSTGQLPLEGTAEDHYHGHEHNGEATYADGQVGLGLPLPHGMDTEQSTDWQLENSDPSFVASSDTFLQQYGQQAQPSQDGFQRHAPHGGGSNYSHDGSRASHSSGPASTNVVAQNPMQDSDVIAGFEAFQASLLQQQLEHIHMQTPAMPAQPADGQSHDQVSYAHTDGQRSDMDSWMARDGSGSGISSPAGRNQAIKDQSLSMAIAAGQILTPGENTRAGDVPDIDR